MLRVVFQSPSSIEHDATLTVWGGAFINALQESWQLGLSASPNILHFPPYGTAETTITISGLPNLVEVGTLGLSFSLVSNYASLGGGFSELTYLTEAAPTGIQSPVWQDVLNDACLWAINQAGVANCSWYTTFYLYWSGVFVYDPAHPYYTYYPTVDDTDYVVERYLLKQLFVDRYTPGYFINGDCADVSDYLQICFKALGIGGSCVQNWSDSQYGFWTNYLCGIGNDATNYANYGPFSFRFHQCTTGSGGAYDAAAAQWKDLSGANYANPPMGWPMSGYWQTARQNPPPGETHYWGLVNRYGNHSNPEGESLGRVDTAVSLVGYK